MQSPLPHAPPEPIGRTQSQPRKDEAQLPHELDINSHESGAMITPGSVSRRRWTLKKQELVRAFLKEHGLADFHTPRKSSRSRVARLLRGQPEEVSLIHAAAREGDCLMLLLALRHGADPLQTTSRGRTALQLALAADAKGAHREVINLLSKPPQTLSVQGFLRSME